MPPHPVRFRVERPARLDRIQVALRLVLLFALGAIGYSSLYWLLYLALPALAALRISEKGSAHYLAEDAPAIARVLRWIAAAYAYLLMLTDAAPTSRADGPVQLEIEPGGAPTIGSALLRLFTSLPALVVLAVLSLAAGLLWPIGAIFVLFYQRLPSAMANYFALTLRYQLRLMVYHLSWVDRYPSFESPHVEELPQAGAA